MFKQEQGLFLIRNPTKEYEETQNKARALMEVNKK